MLPAAAERLADVEPFEAERIEAALREVAEGLGLKPREAFQPIRLALSLARLAGSGRGAASGSSAR